MDHLSVSTEVLRDEIVTRALKLADMAYLGTDDAEEFQEARVRAATMARAIEVRVDELVRRIGS